MLAGAGTKASAWVSLDLPAAVVVVMALHVLHRDPAPHADHERLDLALVLAAGDAEVPALPPVLSPGVGGDLERRMRFLYSCMHRNV